MHEVAGGLFALTHVVGLCEGARTHSLCGRRTPGCSHLRAVVCSAVVSIPAARSERSRVAAWCGLEAHGRARVSATSSPQQSGLGPALCALSSPRLSVYFLQPFFLGGVTQSAYAAFLASGAFHVPIGCLRIHSLDPNLWLTFLFGC